MKIYSKTLAPFFNKQSAFSLIEVLIALVILSFGIMGSGKLLLENAAGFSMAEQRAEALVIAFGIVDYLSVDQAEGTIERTIQYWQNKLDNTLPGSTLTIEHQKLEEKCVYTIMLSFGSLRQKTITLKVAILAIA